MSNAAVAVQGVVPGAMAWTPEQEASIARIQETEGCDRKTAVRKMRAAQKAATVKSVRLSKSEKEGAKKAQAKADKLARKEFVSKANAAAKIVARKFGEGMQLFTKFQTVVTELDEYFGVVKHFFAHKKAGEMLLDKYTTLEEYVTGECDGISVRRFHQVWQQAHALPAAEHESASAQLSASETRDAIDALRRSTQAGNTEWATTWLDKLKAAAATHPEWRTATVEQAIKGWEDATPKGEVLEGEVVETEDATPGPQPAAVGTRQKCDVEGCVKVVVPDWIVKMGGDGTKCYDHGGNVWGRGSGRVPLCSIEGCYQTQELRDPADTDTNTGFCEEHGRAETQTGTTPPEPKPLYTPATPSQIVQAMQQRVDTAEVHASNLKNDLRRLVSEILTHKDELPAWLFELAQQIRMRSLPPEIGEVVEAEAAAPGK